MTTLLEEKIHFLATKTVKFSKLISGKLQFAKGIAPCGNRPPYALHYIISTYTIMKVVSTLFHSLLIFFLGFLPVMNAQPDCNNAIPITLNSSMSGDNSIGSNNVTNYNCETNIGFTGPEAIYELQLSMATEVTIRVTNINNHLDLFLLDACSANSCIAKSITAGFEDEKIIATLGAGIYYIVVDGYEGSTSTFDISVQPTIPCDVAQPLACNSQESYQGGANATTIFSNYNCDGGSSYSNFEYVYELEMEQPGNLRIVLQTFSIPGQPTGNLDLFLLDACDENSCIGSSRNTSDLAADIIEQEVAAGTYYIVAEQKSGFSIVYQIATFCSGLCQDGAEVLPLALDTPITGHTDNGANTNNGNNGYCGNTTNYNGHELVYELEMLEDGLLSLELSGLTDNIDMFLLSDCYPDDCLESSTEMSNQSESIIYGLTAGIYYVVLETVEGISSPFNLSATTLTTLEASNDDNDAYIDVSWNLDKNSCLSPANAPYDQGVKIELLADSHNSPTPDGCELTGIIYCETISNVNTLDNAISGTFRHQVGPGQDVNYTIRVRKIGPGTTLCNEVIQGSTLPFQQPTILEVSDAIRVDSVHLRWVNHSKLSDEFVIYRDGLAIATVEGTTEIGATLHYTDTYQFGAENTLMNGETYNYCIETFSTIHNQAYTPVCDMGSTFDVGFVATDDVHLDFVGLQWNDVAAFCDNIKIQRNGITIANVAATTIFYPDYSPIFGKKSIYSLILVKDGTDLIEIEDIGSVPKNGLISGRVLTQEGLYPVHNVKIKLDGMAGDTVVLDSVQTDFDGYFEFADIYYDLETDFTLLAKKAGKVFIDTALNVTLNSAIFQQTDLLFLEDNGFTTTAAALDLNNFTATPNATADRVDLQWTYTPANNDTTFFNIYRGSDLIARLNDADGNMTTFQDLSGVPDKSYLYTITAFRLLENTGQVVAKTLSQTVVFPVVAPIINIDVSPANTFGVVYLNWGRGHTSVNFTGFRIFRNGKQIADLSSDVYSYTDKDGEPNTSCTYQVVAYRIVNDIDYESVKVPEPGETVTFPPLHLPIDVEATPLPNEDMVELSWEVPVVLTNNYNYDGFYIYRRLEDGMSDFEQIGTLYKNFAPAGNTAIFRDRTGKPNTDYGYAVMSIVKTVDGIYEAAGQFNIVTFPNVQSPSNLTANPDIGLVGLNWNLPVSTNYQGFELYRNGNLLATLAAGASSYTDYASNPPNSAAFNYEIQTFRTIEGEKFYSNAISVNAGPLAGDSTPFLPFNFTASTDLPNHIKLCWNYDPGSTSTFILKRNGTTIANLPTETRSYYDYDAPQAPIVHYSIIADFEGDQTQEIKTAGRLKSFRRISGKVSKANTLQGVPHVRITAQDDMGGTLYYAQTETDSAGYYQLTDVPALDNIDVTVTADADNSDFTNGGAVDLTTSQTITIGLNQEEYPVHFTDYFEMPTTNEIATPLATTATPDPANMGVLIHWSPSNSNYDGFEVFRGTTAIGEVLVGEELNFLDVTGFPGIGYFYGVRAFWEVDEERQYSEIISDATTFPVLEPVVNLNIIPMLGQNRLKVSWSHPYNGHEHYRLERNGLFVAEVKTNTPLCWIDSTGIPNKLYQYTVTAIKGMHQSEAVLASTNYPKIAEVANLNSFVPGSTGQGSPCLSTFASQNHVLLEWDYAANAVDGFEIYRDNILVEQLDGTAMMYEDYEGEPNVEHQYYVVSFLEKEGMRYESDTSGLSRTEIVFPALTHITSINATAEVQSSSVRLDFSYPVNQVEGFYIWRSGEYIDTIFDQSMAINRTYWDNTGSPNQSYTYRIDPFAIRNNEIYFSTASCSSDITFPDLQAPNNFTASQGTHCNFIQLNWDYANNTGIHDFEVVSFQTGETHYIEPGKRSFKAVLNNTALFGLQTYTLRARKIVNGIIYTSTGVDANGWINITDQIPQSIAGVGQFGASLSLEGGHGLVTSPVGNMNLRIYQMNGTKLQNFGPTNFPYLQVANAGSQMLASIPDFQNRGFADFRTITNAGQPNTEEFPSNVSSNTTDGARFGEVLDMYGDYAIIAAPEQQCTDFFGTFTSHSGVVYIYNFNGTSWPEQQRILNINYQINNDISIHEFGRGVAITENDALIYGISQGSPRLYHYKRSGGNWTLESELLFNLISSYTSGNIEIDMEGSRAVVGDKHADKVLILEKGDGDSYALAKTIDRPGNASDFGTAVALLGDYLLIGAAEDDAAGQDKGAVFLYKKEGNDWVQKERILHPNPAISSRFGIALDMTELAYMVGSHGNVFYLHRYMPYNVTATDGTDMSGTTIEWDYDGETADITGFKVYRNDTALPNNIPPASRSFSDTNGDPGKEYVYSVVAVNSNLNFETNKQSDKGYRKSEGKISGIVSTVEGHGVAGVFITAYGLVDGEEYIYNTVTSSDGSYVIQEVFYDSGTGGTDYTVSAMLGGHEIDNNNQILNLKTGDFEKEADFTDNTAYIIKGVVSQKDVNCNLEGIAVKATYNTGGTADATTDANGNYSMVVNLIGISSIDVSIDNEQSISTQDGQMDVMQFDFHTDEPTHFDETALGNFPFVTEINFEDRLTYPVDFRVINTCEAPITNDKYALRIRTLDGCFDKNFETNTNGEATINLPALNYTMKVVGVDNPTATSLTALDFFAAIPTTLNLFDLVRDSAEHITNEELLAMAARDFVYHKAPNIAVTGFDNYFCTAPVAIIQQGETYNLGINITENHGFDCGVKEGMVVIRNNAATDALATVLYDENISGFPVYTFIAGDPSLISPHIYGIIFDYLTEDGEFLGSITLPVFVEGSVGVPGVDVIVDPSNNNQVQYPLFVLRDPPGDNSFSYISSGRSMSETLSIAASEDVSVTVYNETEISISGALIGFNISGTAGASAEQAFEWTYELESIETISTSDSEFDIGRDADVIVGAGIAFQYGLVNEFKVEDCTISKVTKFGIAPDHISTTWRYTVKKIEEIISGYRNDLLRIELGTLQIIQEGEPLDKQSALKLIDNYIKNWEEVLLYHDVKTLPYYLLCAFDPPGDLSEVQKNKVDEWQNSFCGQIGQYQDGEFILNDEIVWTDNLLEQYNRASFAIRNIALDEANADDYGFNSGDWSNIDANNAGFSSTFGVLSENITQSGGISYDKSISNVQASNKSFTQAVTVGLGLDVFGGNDIEMSLGFGSPGAIVINSSSNIETRFGVNAEIELGLTNNYTNELSESTEVGFTIFDDNTVDQHSVTIFQGPAQNHTPYFDLFGGRTSCPPEEGTILIDDPLVFIAEEVDGVEVSLEAVTRYNVPADGTATFNVKMVNNNPFNNTRIIGLYLDPISNPLGAVVKLDGENITTAEAFFFDLVPGVPYYATLTVERGPEAYIYEDLQIFVRDFCLGGENPTIFRSASVSVHFTSPCSPVSIVTPDNHWVLNNGDNKLIVGIQDYDPENSILQEAILEYRRIGAGDDWDFVPLNQLGLMNIVDAPALQDWNAMIAASQIPVYYFEWTVPSDQGLFPDGDYEIRVKMDCGASQTLSNILRGKIDRTGLRLFGTPEPADAIWTAGDEISFSFDKNLDCPLVTNPTFITDNISIIDKSNGDADVPFTMACFNNKVIFLTDSPMSDYDGHILEVQINEMESQQGNGLITPESWSFRVITQNLYWEKADTVKIQLYEGETAQLPIRLENSTVNQTQTGISVSDKTAPQASWINWNPANNFSVTPAGRTINFQISANQAIGTYCETVEVDGLTGQKPELIIELSILPKRPYWEVNPADYSQNMTVTANWRFNTEMEEGAMSKDTMDLISAWIDNEIRGIGKIIYSGNGFYAAYLTVYGDAADINQPLEFRIWDASEGTEYSGYPETDILYNIDKVVGNTANPEVLVVNASKDRARYIPLNQGWTWFSINSEEDDMTVNAQLRSLKNVTDGDIIKTDNKFAQYIDGTGWFAAGDNPLVNLDVHEGYMIYLENGPDTLRLTGSVTTYSDVNLNNNWNWIGFPLQDAKSINSAFTISNLTGGDVIKTTRQNGTSAFSDYNVNTNQWQGALTQLQTNEAYKIQLQHPNGGILTYSNNFGPDGGDQQNRGGFEQIADPADPGTWHINNHNYELTMPVIACIKNDGITQSDVFDKFALFVGNDLRGTGNVINVNEFNNFVVSMIVGATAPNEIYSLYFFDNSHNQVYNMTQILHFNELGYGSFDSPYCLDLNGSVLPVEWLHFSAKAQNKNVLLAWQVAEETNTSHYEVQASETGQTWETIGEVVAKNNATMAYTFLDEHPVEGINYYRIREVEHQGSYSFSKIESVYFGNAGQPIYVYPNPTTGALTVEAPFNTSEKVTVEVFDALGRLVVQQILNPEGQGFETQLELKDMADGVYTLRMDDGESITTERVVKQ